MKVKEKLVLREVITELDFAFWDEILYDEEEELDMDWDIEGENEGHQIHINELMYHLKILEAKGATHIKIDNDIDNHGYILEGYQYKVEKDS
jgi:hypothetical protein